MLYLLTRVCGALDWGSGVPLSANLLGKLNALQVHHIFPKALLYEHGYQKAEVNAIANLCFLTQGTNLAISDSRPEVYLAEVEKDSPVRWPPSGCLWTGSSGNWKTTGSFWLSGGACWLRLPIASWMSC